MGSLEKSEGFFRKGQITTNYMEEFGGRRARNAISTNILSYKSVATVS